MNHHFQQPDRPALHLPDQPVPQRGVRLRPAPSVVDAAPTSGDDDGSVLPEYGMTMIVSATFVGLFVKFLNDGAVASLLTGILSRARALVGW